MVGYTLQALQALQTFLRHVHSHPIWIHCIVEVYQRGVHAVGEGPESVTGPRVLYRAVEKYLQEHGVQDVDQTDVKILAPGSVALVSQLTYSCNSSLSGSVLAA
jgi:hypothetical protein